MDSSYLPYREHSRESVSGTLESLGCEIVGWQGMGIFTDHLVGPVVAEDPAEVLLAEWLAGHKDPYRQVARCYHLIARRGPEPGPARPR
jgi:hypothetical protein